MDVQNVLVLTQDMSAYIVAVAAGMVALDA